MVKIQGNKVWYEHESWELPGKWHGRDENTMINDVAWHPVWHFLVDRSWPYEKLEPAFAPKSSDEIKLKQISGPGKVKIAALPDAANHQTLAIAIDNRPSGEASPYELAVEWNNGTTTNVIKIKSMIVGATTLKIQGSQMWFEQESWQWGDRGEDTQINDKPWHPEWLGDVGNPKFSEPFLDLQPAFAPKNPATIKLTKVAGRGQVEIKELPSPENDETLSIHLDDSPVELGEGADWYEVTIEWQ